MLWELILLSFIQQTAEPRPAPGPIIGWNFDSSVDLDLHAMTERLYTIASL